MEQSDEHPVRSFFFWSLAPILLMLTRSSFSVFRFPFLTVGFFSLLSVLPPSGLFAAEQTFELLTNGSIEKHSPNGKPIGWSTGTLRKGKGDWAVDSEVAHSGKHSLRITRTEKQGSCHWASAYISLKVKEKTPVEFSLWIKAKDSPYITAVVAVESATDRYFQYFTAVSVGGPGYFDWKQLTTNLSFKPGGVRARVFLRQNATGTVWFDDIRLVAAKEIRPSPAKTRKSKTPPMPSAAKPSTVPGDEFEFRNYIRNTRMAGTWRAGKLPPGWTLHNPPETETQAAVTWAKDDPRPGYYAIQCKWLDGGKYVAVRPALVAPIRGRRPMTLLTYPRTESGGRAQLIVESLDRAGRVIQEDRSDIVENAQDYVTLKHQFVTHALTRNIRISCANVGRGSVWFHWLALEPNLEKVAETAAFPFTVSCEPAEGNRFWNGGQAMLHSFVDSPTSVSFAFWGDKTRLKNPRLILDVPRGISIPEAFNMEARSPVSHAKAAFSTQPIERAGAPYVRHVFPGPAALQRLRVRPYLYNCLTMCFVPDRFEKEKEYELFYYLENGAISTSAKRVTLRILPPMPRTPNPKRFKSHLWTLDDINFYDMKLVEKAARKYEEAALAGRERWTGGRAEIHQVNGLLKKRGWTLFYETGDYGFRRSKERAVGADGKPSGRMYCPTWVVSDRQFFREVVAGEIRRELSEAKVLDGETVFLDFEPGSICRKYCFDERCRRRFSERFHIPIEKIRSREEILTNYSKQWGRFWTYLCNEIIRLHSQAVKEANPTLKNALYCYALPFNDSKATENYLFNSPLDTRLNQQHMDRLLLSFYHITGKSALDLIDMNVSTLMKPVYMLPLMGSTTPYWGNITDDQILSPAAMRVQILAAAASGAEGVIPYQGKMMDGMYFIAIDQAMQEIAAVEDLYFDGQRWEQQMKFALVAKGKPLNGSATGPLLVENKDEFIGFRAHRLGNRILLTLFNFHPDRGALIKVSSKDGIPPVAAIVDPLNKRSLKRRNEDASDMIFFLPSTDVKLFILE